MPIWGQFILLLALTSLSACVDLSRVSVTEQTRELPQPTAAPSASGLPAPSSNIGAPTGLYYPKTEFQFFVGIPINPIRADVSGPSATLFQSIPSLPLGVFLNPTTGFISGTPSAASALSTYEIRASNAKGYASRLISLSVASPVTPSSTPRPSVSPTPRPTLTPSPTPRPTATPTPNPLPTATPSVQPTATPTPASGSAPSALIYPMNSYTFTLNTGIRPFRPNVAGGTATLFTVLPDLPAGVTLDPITGAVYGVPSQLAPGRAYEFKASNEFGFATQTLFISVQNTGGDDSVTTPPPVQMTPAPLGGTDADTREPSSYSAPLIIRRGGTYTGNYRTTAMGDQSYAVKIETDEPVILENCHLAGPGILLNARYARGRITVRNCSFHGYAPTQDNMARGRAIDATQFRHLRIENNFFENTGTPVYTHEYVGDGTPNETVIVRYNRVRNINGKARNTNEWIHAYFQQFVGIQGYMGNNPRGAVIAWNDVINEPGKSASEDLINFHNSGGRSDSWFKVHDNFLKGSYRPDPYAHASSAAGVQIDGELHRQTAYIEVYNNQILQIHNGGMGAAAGSNIYMHHNLVISSSLDALGRVFPSSWGGIHIFAFYPENDQVGYMENIRLEYNTVGWVHTGTANPYPNRNDITENKLGGIRLTTHLPNAPITLEMEAQEYQSFLAKAAAAGIKIGPQR